MCVGFGRICRRVFFLDKLFPCLLFLVKLFLHVTNQLYFCLLKFHKFVSVSDKQSRLYSVIAGVHFTFFFFGVI